MNLLQILFLSILLIVFSCERTVSESYGHLVTDYYKQKCPMAEEIVQRQVQIAVLKDPRMAASLLRLHFHDCFVMGCDASVLLDSIDGIVSEKQAGPNLNSLRGFEVVDKIKWFLEEACPCTVSCADILAIAARDSVALRGGPWWNVYLGRKDSLKASFNGANQFIPLPNSSLETLISNFKVQGLDIRDLVALSGSHTMGKARCVSFRQRIYDKSSEEETLQYDHHHHHHHHHLHLHLHDRTRTFRRILGSICPKSGRDNAIAPLDLKTPARFDNHYYHNLVEGKGLLHSDNVLLTEDYEGEIRKHVWSYAQNQDYFFDSFAKSMIKMGNINVLVGDQGQVRKTCRFIN